jgi:hypothetical protein
MYWHLAYVVLRGRAWWREDEAPGREESEDTVQSNESFRDENGVRRPLLSALLLESQALISLGLLNYNHHNRSKLDHIFGSKQSVAQRAKFYLSLISEIHECGVWIRFGMMLPMVAQYVKLVAVRGPWWKLALSRLLGTVCFLY